MKNRPMVLLFFSVFLGIIIYLSRIWLLFLLLPILAIINPIQQFPRFQKSFSFLLFTLFFSLGFIRTAQVLAPLTYIQSNIEEGEIIQFRGELYKKDVKESGITYYLRDVISEGECLGNVIYYPSEDYASLGSILSLSGSATYFESARNEGGFDAKTYYYSQNIYLKMEEVSGEEVLASGNVIWEQLFQLQQRIKQVEVLSLPQEEGGLLAAITVGDRGEMDEEVKNLFANVGISHIIAVSGLHVSVVGMGLYRLLRRRRHIASSAICAGIVVVLYGVMCGNSVSTIRAVGMFLLSLTALVMLCDYDACTAIFVMASFLLLKNPLYLYHISFQLSFVIVLGVVSIASPLGNAYDVHCRLRWEKTHKKSKGRRWKKDRKERLIRSLIVSICIQLCSLPMILWHFYTIPLYSLLLNLILLPLIGILLGCGLFAGFVGALFPIPIAVLKLLFLPSHWILYFYEMLSSLVSKLPYCSLAVGRPNLYLLLFYYSALILLARYLVHIARTRLLHSMKLEDEYGRSYSPLPARYQRCIVIVMACLLLLPVLFFIRKPEDFEIAMLDVGQGDGIYLQDGMGGNYFIDGGSTSASNVGTRVILPFFKYRGIQAIDNWYVTHPDLDHISGLIEVLDSGYDVKRITVAKYIVRNDNFSQLIEAAENNGTEVFVADVGDTWKDEEKGHEFLLQTIYAGNETELEDANANSLVLYLAYDDFEGVFTGDIGSEQENVIISNIDKIKNIDFLKVAHHGSNYSSSEAWCEFVDPAVAFCSVGEKNRYGHPGIEAVSRLENTGAKIYYTKDAGELMLSYVEHRIIVKEMVR